MQKRVYFLIPLLMCCIQFQFWSAVSASPFLDVNEFEADVYSRVLRGTKDLPINSVGKETVVCFTVLRNGSVINLRVTRKSDSSTNDQRALEAVRTCAPFKNIPADGPNSLDFKIEINYNSLTWEAHCDPVSLEAGTDVFLSKLAHSWHPPRMKSFSALSVRFKVDSEGGIVDATLGQTSQWPAGVWLEGLSDFVFDQCTLMEAKSCLHDQHISKGTTIEYIDVMFFYDPRPRKETVQHNLIGTDCGPCRVDYASGFITFSDPHP